MTPAATAAKAKPSVVAPRPGDPAITPALIAEHGLTTGEYDKLVDMLGRTPTFTELGIVSALWSEHCSYKHSRPLLRTLPTKAPWVLQGPGENAGVISIGDGLAVAFKIESHNHPSAVEPYQGAATGVGGILRDVFTMGARPVALLNSLRFGSLDSARVRYLFSGVVKGIGDYGNCMGVPTIGGEVSFDPSYEGNPLVNAMCVGLLREEELILAVASGVGNPIIAVGARTGRDGIHGASFASADLSEENEAKRPMVQVGDPFTEKLLLEASLELIKSGPIVAIQDMGAAGSDVVVGGDGGARRRRRHDRHDQGSRSRSRHDALRDPAQRVAGADARRRQARARSRGQGDSRPVGPDDGGDRRGDRRAGVSRHRRRSGRRRVPGIRLVTDCPTYTPEARESSDIVRLRAQRCIEHSAARRRKGPGLDDCASC